MPKDSTINQIKQKVSILDLARKSGCKLKKHGSKDFATLCLWHKDKTPSLILSPDKNLFHCLGCGKAGSVIDWVMLTDGKTTAEAIKLLEDEYLSKPSNGSRTSPTNGKKYQLQKPAILEQVSHNNLSNPENGKALQLVCEFYSKSLKQNKRAVDYLVKRGITYGEIIDSFGIGYADGTLLDKLPNNDKLIETLHDIGILRGKQESFADYLIFPVIDENGIITEVYGRSLTRGKPKHLYLPGAHAGIYNPKCLNASSIILCESIIDALSLMTLGYMNVTASYGTNGFTQEMFLAFVSSGIKKVFIAYDADRAGDRASEGLSKRLSPEQIDCYRVHFPDGTDANDFIRNTENARDEFTTLLNNAKDITITERKPEAGELLTPKDKQTNVTNSLVMEEKNGEYKFNQGERSYIVRGLKDNKSNTNMKVFLRAVINKKFHNDNHIDLFSSKSVSAFIKAASVKLELDGSILKKDLDNITLRLDKVLNDLLDEKNKPSVKEFKVNLHWQHKAMELLADPLLLKHIAEYIKKCGIVGESLNSIICFLATISRKLNDPLHIVIQSESSAGKSTLLRSIIELVPPEDLLYFTQLTAQSLYYMEDGALKHKVLAIAELDGAQNTLYPLKQLMSENKIAISSTGSDPETGQHKSSNYEKEGPAAVFVTIPKEGFDEEIENRSVMLAMNESEKQTMRIQASQRQKRSLEGIKMYKDKKQITELLHNVGRLVKQIPVYNPYAKDLTFSTANHHTRRHNDKYLIIIETITLLYQHQREKIFLGSGHENKYFVKTHLIDIAIANFIARRIFGRSLDELSVQSRNFLRKVENLIIQTAKENHIDIEDCWVYRKDMRLFSKLSNTRVHEHVSRLVLFEYLAVKRDMNGYAYKLLYNPLNNKEEENYNLNLQSVESLKKKASKEEWQQFLASKDILDQIFKSIEDKIA